jgi:hypothetical protein
MFNKILCQYKNVHKIKLIISNSDPKLRWDRVQFLPFPMLVKCPRVVEQLIGFRVPEFNDDINPRYCCEINRRIFSNYFLMRYENIGRARQGFKQNFPGHYISVLVPGQKRIQLIPRNKAPYSYKNIFYQAFNNYSIKFS